MADSEIKAEFVIGDGSRIRKYESDNGIVYRNMDSNEFVSPKVGEALENNQRVEYTITPKRERDRQRAIKERYPEWENTEGLSPDTIRAEDGRVKMSTKSWMDNTELRQKVKNDPLIDESEEMRAREALARQIAQDLEGVEDADRIKILKQYDLY